MHRKSTDSSPITIPLTALKMLSLNLPYDNYHI